MWRTENIGFLLVTLEFSLRNKVLFCCTMWKLFSRNRLLSTHIIRRWPDRVHRCTSSRAAFHLPQVCGCYWQTEINIRHANIQLLILIHCWTKLFCLEILWKYFSFIGFKTFKSVLNSPQPRSVVEMIATWRTAWRDKPERRPWLGPRQWDDWDDVAGCWERSSSPGRKEAWREEWREHGEMC